MTLPLIRAVVVDEHPAMRAGIAAVLDQAPDIECCGEAASGAELWPLIQRTAPDAVVLDWHLPGRRRPRALPSHQAAAAGHQRRALLRPRRRLAARAGAARPGRRRAGEERACPGAVRDAARGGGERGPPALTPSQRAALDGVLAPEDVGIAGMLLLGTPLREIAAASGLEPAELSERIEQMLVRVTAAHGPAVTYGNGAE